jgi:hypothetical protein
VPYTFAHPAAVLLIHRPLGRLAVPSAMVIGSMVPDLWHFLPFVERSQTHSIEALLFFCLPAGLALYFLFHRLLKQPLIALLPRALSCRLGGFCMPGVPPVRLPTVIASLFAGALTHLGWDFAIAAIHHGADGANWLRHGSTLAGTLALAAWLWHVLSRAPVGAPPAHLAGAARRWTIAALAAVLLLTVWVCAAESAWKIEDLAAFKRFARHAGIAAATAVSATLLAYCLLWQLRNRR